MHLPDQQAVTFDEQDDMADVLAVQHRTKLTQWLAYNQLSGDTAARQLTYVQFPEQYKWDRGSWSRRCNPSEDATVGRIYWVSPRAGEKYFLRVLLHHVQGAGTFEQLRTVDGAMCPTFRDACVKRGLLQDDAEWKACLQEASETQNAWQMRSLFCILLEYNSPSRLAFDKKLFVNFPLLLLFCWNWFSTINCCICWPAFRGSLLSVDAIQGAFHGRQTSLHARPQI